MTPRKDLARELGLRVAPDVMTALFSDIKNAVLTPGKRTATGHLCKAFPSLIPAASAPPTPGATSLVIDIGGTNFRATFETVDQRGRAQARVLLTERIANLGMPLDSGDSYGDFCRLSSERIAAELRDQPIDALALGWSYPFTAIPSPDSSRSGFDGVISSRVEGYKKGSIIITDLKDGDSVTAPLLAALGRRGVKPGCVIVGNDTVFTMKALPGCHAGVIASSGANATVVYDGNITNSELGAFSIVPGTALGIAEQHLSNIRLEAPMSGKTLPLFFQANVKHLVETRRLRASPFVEKLLKDAPNADGVFEVASPELMSALVRGEGPAELDPESLTILTQLALALEARAGSFAGLLCALSVCNLPVGPKRIALDSSQARNFPHYLEHLRETLNMLDGLSSVELLRPIDEISIPTRGAFEALYGFLRA